MLADQGMLTPHETEIEQLNLNNVIRELEAIKANNGGKMPYGTISKVVEARKRLLPWLSINHVKYQMKKNKKLFNEIYSSTTTSTSTFSADMGNAASSSLTFASLSTMSTSDFNAPRNLAPAITTNYVSSPVAPATTPAIDLFYLFQTQQDEEEGGGEISFDSQQLNELTSAEQNDTHNIKHTCENFGEGEMRTADAEGSVSQQTTSTITGGRPKGATAAAVRDVGQRHEIAMREICDLYAVAQENFKDAKRRVKNGTLAMIITEAKARNGLPEETFMNRSTIVNRVSQKMGHRHGRVSPMLAIEPYMVELIHQLARMRNPISVSDGLRLANSLISGTKIGVSINSWRQTHSSAYRSNKNPKLGMGYWRGFMKRNKDLVTAKHGVKFESKRADWCTYNNFEAMYEQVYKEMVAGGIAVEFPNKEWLNKEGVVVLEEKDALGLQTKYNLIRPDRLLFVDEVGSNTSQTKDGNVGGELFLCGKGERPQQRSAHKDAHFTVLGFTAANGNPIMCAIIFAAKTLEDEWVLGLDPFAEWVGDENNLLANSGKNTCGYLKNMY